MKKSESVNGPVDEEWAVPVTDPVKDFHTRVPDMAREVSCILKKAQSCFLSLWKKLPGIEVLLALCFDSTTTTCSVFIINSPQSHVKRLYFQSENGPYVTSKENSLN